MHIVEANGQTGVVSGWKVVQGVMTMYNLEVALDHAFVVGVGMWVVHNCENDIVSNFPGDYLAKPAPNQVTPGVENLRNVYLDSHGNYHYSVSSYDEFGRVIGRTDVEPGTFGKDPIHYHTFGPMQGGNMGKGFPLIRGWGETGSHLPGIFDPFDK
jgi:hypothetical protein